VTLGCRTGFRRLAGRFESGPIASVTYGCRSRPPFFCRDFSDAVAADTGGAVTASRALNVYLHRKSVANATGEPEPVVDDGAEPGWIRQCRDVFYFAIMSESLDSCKPEPVRSYRMDPIIITTRGDHDVTLVERVGCKSKKGGTT